MNRTATMFRAILIVVLFAIPSFAQPPATIWLQVLPGHTGYGVKPTSDGGYIVVGNDYLAGDYDRQMVKTDSTGVVEWSQQSGSYEWNEGLNDVHQTADQGYIMVGVTGSMFSGSQLHLIKRDADGNSMWSSSHGGSGSESGVRVEPTATGGYVAFGTTSSGLDNVDGYIIETDSVGTELWSGNYGSPNNDYSSCGQVTSDGGYILAGKQQDSNYYYDIWIMKVDADGIQQWSRTYGGDDQDWVNDCMQTSDSGYILTGFTRSFGAGTPGDAVLMKTDAYGDLIWTRKLGGVDHDRGYTVIELPDGGYLMAGTGVPTGSDTNHTWLVRTDSDGNVLWDEYYGEDDFSSAYDIEPTVDGGFILAGRTQAPDYGIMLLRLGAEGLSHLTLTLAPINPPVIIPAGGGSFEFAGVVANTLGEPIHFDAWTELVFPGGGTYRPALLWRDLTLEAGQTIDPHPSQSIPAELPPGTYVYRGVVGSYPNTVYSSDEFEIVKQAP